MTKSDLINVLHSEMDITKQDAVAIVNQFFGEMSNALANDDRVEIRGLCSIYVKKYDAYTGRNPRTGEKVKIKSKKLPFFKLGRELKDRANHK